MSNQPGSKPPSPTAKHGQPWVIGFVFGVFGICLVRLAGFVYENAVDLLYEDQWDSLRALFDGSGPWRAFFMQNGPSRLGLGNLINWFLYDATQWDVRAEAWAGVITLCLSTITALALSVRLRGQLAWTDAAFPLLLLSPVHWEALTFTPFFGSQIMPLAITLLLAYFWASTRPIAQRIGVGLLGPLVLFSGYGICAAPVAIGLAILLWLRPTCVTQQTDRRSASFILFIMGVAVALFFIEYHWSTGTSNWTFPVSHWWDYPRFCALMFTSLLGWRAITVGSVATGSLLLCLVVVSFLAATLKLWRREAAPRARIICLLTGTSLSYAALTAIGRLPTSLEAAFMWRYIALMMPALCGLSFAVEAWTRTRGRNWQIGFCLCWFALACVVWGNFTPENQGAALAKGKRLWVASYLETRDLNSANITANFEVYSPQPTSPRIAEKLRWLEQRHLSFFRTASPEKVRGQEPQPDSKQ